MDPNIAAWMIAGGPRVETRRSRLEREQLQAFIESQRARPSTSIAQRLVDRLRPAGGHRETAPVCLDAACCAA